MNSVGDTGENIDGKILLKFFPKTVRKRILFKARIRIQFSGHINFKHIYFFEFHQDILNLKIF